MAKSSKGSQWERDVCKFMSKWVTGQEKPYLFWRGHGSGAMFTNNANVGQAFSGDIYAVSEEGKFFTDLFSIECKNGYPKTSLDLHFKYNKSDDFKDFWTQTTNDAEKSSKFPLLIFKKKGLTVQWLCISQEVYSKFDKYLGNIRCIKIGWVDLPDMYIFSMEEFFENVTCEIFKREFELI